MVKRRNFAPPLGPDACACGALAQTTLTASHDTLRRLGYSPDEHEPASVRVCVACYLRGMAEAQARTGVRISSTNAYNSGRPQGGGHR